MRQYSIPLGVSHLTFGKCFNQPLDQYSIPDSVHHLTFGKDFNKPLYQHSIPISVSHALRAIHGMNCRHVPSQDGA